MRIIFRFLLATLAVSIPLKTVYAETGRTIVDSRGIPVTIPAEIRRVVTISDGLVEGVMTVMGVEKRLVAVGSAIFKQKGYRFSIPQENGKSLDLAGGMHTVVLLNPWIVDLPSIANWNTAPNYEKIAGLAPDIMIIRVGSCWHWKDSDQIPKSIRTLESLGIPVVVLNGPNTYETPDIKTLGKEIEILGEIFDRKKEARALADYLAAQVDFVSRRTASVPNAQRPRVMLLGLSPNSRQAGGAGMVLGRGTIDSYLLEEVVHAVNAFGQRAYFRILGTEQILALNPDAILLPTAMGYHPAGELYHAPYYAALRDLSAVQHRRVAALPWMPCNCDKRLEFPVDLMVMAKTAYPGIFKDIDLGAWLIDFYRKVYRVDERTARRLRSAQWMDWAVEKKAED